MSALALTLRQPWASLVMFAGKDVENRSWPLPRRLPGHDHPPRTWCDECWTGRPFRLWIHAGSSIDATAWRSPALRGVHATTVHHLPTGVLLGSVTVTGCHHADECTDAGGCNCGAVDNGVGVEHEPRCGEGEPCSPWAEADRWHWTLADPQPLDTPIPMKGAQRLWRLPVGAFV